MKMLCCWLMSGLAAVGGMSPLCGDDFVWNRSGNDLYSESMTYFGGTFYDHQYDAGGASSSSFGTWWISPTLSSESYVEQELLLNPDGQATCQLLSTAQVTVINTNVPGEGMSHAVFDADYVLAQVEESGGSTTGSAEISISWGYSGPGAAGAEFDFYVHLSGNGYVHAYSSGDYAVLEHWADDSTLLDDAVSTTALSSAAGSVALMVNGLSFDDGASVGYCGYIDTYGAGDASPGMGSHFTADASITADSN